jgi:hypothetical protein
VTSGGATNATVTAQAKKTAASIKKVQAIRAQFAAASELTGAAGSFLRTLPEAGLAALWCLLLFIVIAGPPIASKAWKRRRT